MKFLCHKRLEIVQMAGFFFKAQIHNRKSWYNNFSQTVKFELCKREEQKNRSGNHSTRRGQDWKKE